MAKARIDRGKPYPLDDDCPCESGFSYRDCCKAKAFKFRVNKRGDVIRSVKLHPEAKKIIEKQLADFRRLFGRKPGRKDKVFFQSLLWPKNALKDEFKLAALEAGLDPGRTYATWKTGLFPVQGKENLYPEIELEEWSDAVDDYHERVSNGEDPFQEGPNFTEAENAIFERLMVALTDAVLILASIIDRGVKIQLKVRDFFRLFFVVQSLSYLKRFKEAAPTAAFDGGMQLGRSVYESAIRIRYLRYDASAAETFLALASIGGEYEYLERRGKKDWNFAVHKATGKKLSVRLTNFDMVATSGEQLDADVYQILFRKMSAAVHPNVDNITQYYSLGEGFSLEAADNPIEGMVVYAFVLVLFFTEITHMKFLDRMQRRDARFMALKIARLLLSFRGPLRIFAGEFSCINAKLISMQTELRR